MVVRYFAAASEAAGKRSEVVDASTMTVGEVKAILTKENPTLARVFEISSLLADGVRVTDEDTQMAGVAQLDVLPPFAGG